MNREFAPVFMWELFQQLRRRGFLLGIADYDDLRRSICLGYGIDSRQALSELCCALWAKSRQDGEVILALLQNLYENNNIPAWEIDAPKEPGLKETLPVIGQVEKPVQSHAESEKQQRETRNETSGVKPDQEEQVIVEPRRGLPEITLQGVDLQQSHFVFIPQYPLSYRQVVQAWRRLRNPIRRGPPVDLDIQATIRRQAETGIAVGAVLTPRRINAARLLILEDRHGSMTPFQNFVTEVCQAIKNSANFELVRHFYFHDLPVHGTDLNILGDLKDQLFPKLDPILSQIQPLENGDMYRDADLYQPVAIPEVLDGYARGTFVVIISDAGAARRSKDILRLLDTIAFLKALHLYTRHVVWLNPLSSTNWAGTLAEQISRHIPMLPLDNPGSHQAVNILRGQPVLLQRSL